MVATTGRNKNIALKLLIHVSLTRPILTVEVHSTASDVTLPVSTKRTRADDFCFEWQVLQAVCVTIPLFAIGTLNPSVVGHTLHAATTERVVTR